MAEATVNHQVKNADKMPLRFHENEKPGQETKDKKIESASSKLHYIREHATCTKISPSGRGEKEN